MYKNRKKTTNHLVGWGSPVSSVARRGLGRALADGLHITFSLGPIQCGFVKYFAYQKKFVWCLNTLASEQYHLHSILVDVLEFR